MIDDMVEPSPKEDSPRQNRVNNFIFGKEIGKGAYAVVRIATSREDNKKYAIKIYDKTKL
jgi:serine/threonine protein kinase